MPPLKHPESNPQIIVLGSINVDLVIRAAKLPRPGETVMGGEFYQAAGGKGANQAVAAARTASSPVAFIAAVGADELGRSTLKTLRQENLDLRYVRMIDGQATGVALIAVDEHGQNQISVASGANAQLTPDDVNAVDDSLFAQAKVFLACLESPLETVVAGLKRAKQFGLKTILNPAPARVDIKDRALMELVDLITPNESEAELLTGWDAAGDLEDAIIACDQLRQLGCQAVVLTRGASGCMVRDESREASLFGAQDVTAVDTTAAGDCFNGALASALADGQDLRDAVRFASVAAGISVTRKGAIPSLPTKAEIAAFRATNE